jgi:hypothetical protein
VTLNYSTANGTATVGEDYTAASGTLTFAPGETTKTITVNVIGDTVAEPDESFNVTLSNPTSGLTITDGLGVITITNDDALPSVSVSATNGGEGAGPVVFTFTRSGSTAASLVVNVTTGGTASFASDVNAPTVTGGSWNGTNTITFNAGSSTVTLSYGIVNDVAVEGDETLVFNVAAGGTYAVGSPSSATGTIVDNDFALPAVTITATNGVEGGAAVSVSVSRTGSTAGTLTVSTTQTGTWATDMGAPVVTGGTYVGGNVTFNAGVTTVVMTFAVVDDSLIEGTETFGIAITAGSGYTLGSPSAANANITDNDLPLVSVSSTNGAEGGAAVVVTFTRTGPTTNPLTISASQSGSATLTGPTADVAAPVAVGGSWNSSTNTVTFNAGASTVTLTFSVVNDITFEGPETLGFAIAAGSGYGLGTPTSTTATIADDDVATPPTVTVTATNGGEGTGNVVFTFSRTGSTAASLAITANLTGTASTADWTGPSATGGSWNGASTVTFNAGSSTVTLIFGVVDDPDVEATESMTFTIAAGGGYTLGSPSTATGTITDNEPPPGAILSINSTTVTESDNGRPAVTVTLTVTRTGNLGITSTVHWSTVAGTALAGSDFTAASGNLTFNPGDTSKTIVISIAADKKAEPTEQFSVTLDTPSANTTLGTATGTVTIQDNDGALLATAAGASASAQPLAQADAINLLAVVVREWLDAGATAVQLAGLTIRIADMPGNKLADTLGRTITLDIDAAGWGWALSPLALTADRMDLASVLAHELGHVLGLEHEDHGVMEEMLAPGESLPAPESSTLAVAAGHPVNATTTVFAAHDQVRSIEIVAATQLAPAVAAAAHAEVVLPVTRELITGPGRSVTESAIQAFSRVSPSQQGEPLTVVLLGLALAALIGRRRGILVRILVRSRSR